MKILSLILLFCISLLYMNCAKTIIKISNPATVPDISKPNYKKTYFNYADGFVEYTRPVTPNKPQSLRGYKSKLEKEKHINPVCANNVDAIVIYPDFVDSLVHTVFGGIVSTRSVLVYCNQ